MERTLVEPTTSAPTLPEASGTKELPIGGPERRERIRVITQLPLTVKFGGVYETMAEAANISARGMFFMAQERLEVGTAIELVFRLPRRVIGVEGVWLRCAAEVIRVEAGMPEGKFGIAAQIKGYEVFRVS